MIKPLYSLALFTTLILFITACESGPDAPGESDAELPALATSAPLLVDYDRNVYIPNLDDLVRTLEVAFVYNSDSIQVRYRYATDTPSWYHQYLIYENGDWVRYGGGGAGPDPHGLYEDRISMQLDDGSVDGFAQLGGFVTIHPGMRTLTNEASGDDVASHPYLGDELGRDDVRKFIPESREGDMEEGEQWHQTRGPDEIDRLRDDGVFLDLWQWRSHRSNPLGYADNGYVLEYRHGSEGTGMYTDNRDDEGRPRYMFDPEITGRLALRKDSLIDRHYGQDDPYFIFEGNAVPFDPDHDWQEGDAIPQRFLQEPEGSRGALKADGYWEDGAWHLSVTRTLEAPDPRDSKALEEGGTYHVAFAVHADGSGARWHYVSVPYALGIGDTDGASPTLRASHTDGPLQDADVEWTEIPVFYPGQVDYSWLLSPDHPGHYFVQEGEMHMLQIHQIERLSKYIVRQELELLGEDPSEYGMDELRSW